MSEPNQTSGAANVVGETNNRNDEPTVGVALDRRSGAGMTSFCVGDGSDCGWIGVEGSLGFVASLLILVQKMKALKKVDGRGSK